MIIYIGSAFPLGRIRRDPLSVKAERLLTQSLVSRPVCGLAGP